MSIGAAVTQAPGTNAHPTNVTVTGQREAAVKILENSLASRTAEVQNLLDDLQTHRLCRAQIQVLNLLDTNKLLAQSLLLITQLPLEDLL
jgi:hypothetical protein